MKKIKLGIIIFTSLIISTIGCSDFDDINVDPNNTTTVAPSALFTSAMTSIQFVVGSNIGELWSQHMSETQYTSNSRYQTVNYNFNGWYTGPLADLQHIIELNSEPESQEFAQASGSNANQIAVARILKSYFFHIITDAWGPIPYSGALQGRDNFRPAYDSQETIYRSMLSELKAAIVQIDNGRGISGDIIFDGEMDLWKQFANTLRLNIALRMSEVDPTGASSEFVSALNDGVIQADVMYPFLSESNNQKSLVWKICNQNGLRYLRCIGG